MFEDDFTDDEFERSFDMQFGECYFGSECCMLGPHYPMECYTAEMAMEQDRYYRMLELEEGYPIVRLTRRAADWLRRLFTLPKKVVVDDEIPF